MGHERHFAEGIEKERERLLVRALSDGPTSMTLEEKRILLTDSARLARLHTAVWALQDEKQFERWCPIE